MAIIDVLLQGSKVSIDRSVFLMLFENSVACERADFLKALETGTIHFSDLVQLSRAAEIPYSLFFAPTSVVESQIQDKINKLLQGVTKDTFSLNSRHAVPLKRVELIVKDLLRKQELLKRHDSSLEKNRIVGILKRPGKTIEDDALKLLAALKLPPGSLRAAKNKSGAIDLLVRTLESNQIFVAQSVNNFMPQRLQGLKFSGITIKDSRVPIIFLAGGDHGDAQEPAGRQVFTLVLMTVLVARGVFAPVTYSGNSPALTPAREYDLVGEILMPKSELSPSIFTSTDRIQNAADEFKVTQSALVVRGARLGMLSQQKLSQYLDEFDEQYRNLPKPQPRAPKPINGLRKYNGRELSFRMLDALDAGKITAGDFRRVILQNKVSASQINDYREALK